MLETRASSVWTPKIDTNGLVFQSPLWHPTMQARQGVIASGTGTMAVTPLVLAVGANTVTATGAGTFLVTMPQGGTVASAGAIVTGSPVTIPASVPTSVTLEGAGTFTCTVTDNFRSKDSNRHLMTNVGATWGKYGRTFAGAEYVDCGNPVSLQLQYFTVLAWARSTVATNQEVFSHAGESASGWHLTLTTTTRVVTGDSFVATINDINPGVNPMDGVWRLWGFDRAVGNSCRLTMNGVVLDTDTYAGTFGFTGNFQLGRRSAAEGNYLTGGLGEAWVYSRALTTGEIKRLYQATQWRYKS